jgi:hypothetical protein
MRQRRDPRDDQAQRTREPPGPVPTLAQLRRETCWLSVYCKACPHAAPMAIVPLIIRWGCSPPVGAASHHERLKRIIW